MCRERLSRNRKKPRKSIGRNIVDPPPGDEEGLRNHIIDDGVIRATSYVPDNRLVVIAKQRLESDLVRR
jgi:hypothetical protein